MSFGLHFAVAFISFVFKITSSGFASAQICPYPDGIYAVQEDCTSFLRCESGNSQIVPCPRNLSFNPHKLTCDYNTEDNCVTKSRSAIHVEESLETNEYRCPEKGSSIQPSSNSCSEYYRCVNGTAYRENCPNGLLMNREILTCDYADKVSCDIFRQRRLLQDYGAYDDVEVDNPQELATASSVPEGDEANLDPESNDSVNGEGAEDGSEDDLQNNAVDVEDEPDDSTENSAAVNEGKNEDVSFTDILLPTATSLKNTYETTSEVSSITTKMLLSNPELIENKAVESDGNASPSTVDADKSNYPSSQSVKYPVSSTLSYDKTFNYSPNPSPTSGTTIAIRPETKEANSVLSFKGINDSTLEPNNINNHTITSATEPSNNLVTKNELELPKQEVSEPSTIANAEFDTEVKTSTTESANKLVTENEFELANQDESKFSTITNAEFATEMKPGTAEPSNYLVTEDEFESSKQDVSEYSTITDAEFETEVKPSTTEHSNNLVTEDEFELSKQDVSESSTLTNAEFKTEGKHSTTEPTNNLVTEDEFELPNQDVSEYSTITTTEFETEEKPIKTTSLPISNISIKQVQSSFTTENMLTSQTSKSEVPEDNISSSLDTDDTSYDIVSDAEPTFEAPVKIETNTSTEFSLLNTTVKSVLNGTTDNATTMPTILSTDVMPSNYTEFSQVPELHKAVNNTTAKSSESFTTASSLKYTSEIKGLMTNATEQNIMSTSTYKQNSDLFQNTTAVETDLPTVTADSGAETSSPKISSQKASLEQTTLKEMVISTDIADANGINTFSSKSALQFQTTLEQNNSTRVDDFPVSSTPAQLASETIYGDLVNESLSKNENMDRNPSNKSTIGTLLSTTTDAQFTEVTTVLPFATTDGLPVSVVTPVMIDKFHELSTTVKDREYTTTRETANSENSVVTQEVVNILNTTETETLLSNISIATTNEPMNSIETTTNGQQTNSLLTTMSQQKSSEKTTQTENESSRLFTTVTNQQRNFEEIATTNGLIREVQTTPMGQQMDSITTSMIDEETRRVQTTKVNEQTTRVESAMLDKSAISDETITNEHTDIVQTTTSEPGSTMATTSAVNESSSLFTGASDKQTSFEEVSIVDELTSDVQTTPVGKQKDSIMNEQKSLVETTTIDAQANSIETVMYNKQTTNVQTAVPEQKSSAETTPSYQTSSLDNSVYNKQTSNLNATVVDELTSVVQTTPMGDDNYNVTTTIIDEQTNNVETTVKDEYANRVETTTKDKYTSDMKPITIDKHTLNVVTSTVDGHANNIETSTVGEHTRMETTMEEKRINVTTTTIKNIPTKVEMTRDELLSTQETNATDEQLSSVDATTIYEKSSEGPTPKRMERFSTVPTTAIIHQTMSMNSTTADWQVKSVETTVNEKQPIDVATASIIDQPSSVITTATDNWRNSADAMTPENLVNITKFQETLPSVSAMEIEDHTSITETPSEEQTSPFKTTTIEYTSNIEDIATEEDKSSMATSKTEEQLISVKTTSTAESATREKIPATDDNISTTSAVEKQSTLSFTTIGQPSSTEETTNKQNEEISVSTTILEDVLSTLKSTEAKKELLDMHSTTEREIITIKSQTGFPTISEDETTTQTLTSVADHGTSVTTKDYLNIVVTATTDNILNVPTSTTEGGKIDFLDTTIEKQMVDISVPTIENDTISTTTENRVPEEATAISEERPTVLTSSTVEEQFFSEPSPIEQKTYDVSFMTTVIPNSVQITSTEQSLRNVGSTMTEGEIENETTLPTEKALMNVSTTTGEYLSSTTKEQPSGLVTTTIDPDLNSVGISTTTDKNTYIKTKLIPEATTEKYVNDMNTNVKDKYLTTIENAFQTENVTTNILTTTSEKSTESIVPTKKEPSNVSTVEFDELQNSSGVTTTKEQHTVSSTTQKQLFIVDTSASEKHPSSADSFSTEDVSRKDKLVTEDDFNTIETTKTEKYLITIDNAKTKQPQTTIKYPSKFKTTESDERPSSIKTTLIQEHRSGMGTSTVELYTKIFPLTTEHTSILPPTADDQLNTLNETTDVDELSSIGSVLNTEHLSHTDTITSEFSGYSSTTPEKFKTVTTVSTDEANSSTTAEYTSDMGNIKTDKYLTENDAITTEENPSRIYTLSTKKYISSIDPINTENYPSSPSFATTEKYFSSIDFVTTEKYPSSVDVTTDEYPSSVDVTTDEYPSSIDIITTKEYSRGIDVSPEKYSSSINPITSSSINPITTKKYTSRIDFGNTEKYPSSIDIITTENYPSNIDFVTTETSEKYFSSLPATTEVQENDARSSQSEDQSNSIFTTIISGDPSSAQTTAAEKQLQNTSVSSPDKYSKSMEFTAADEHLSSTNTIATDHFVSDVDVTTEVYSRNNNVTTSEDYSPGSVTATVIDSTFTVPSSKAEDQFISLPPTTKEDLSSGVTVLFEEETSSKDTPVTEEHSINRDTITTEKYPESAYTTTTKKQISTTASVTENLLNTAHTTESEENMSNIATSTQELDEVRDTTPEEELMSIVTQLTQGMATNTTSSTDLTHNMTTTTGQLNSSDIIVTETEFKDVSIASESTSSPTTESALTSVSPRGSRIENSTNLDYSFVSKMLSTTSVPTTIKPVFPDDLDTNYCNNGDGIFPDNNNCSMYVHCLDGSPHFQSCPVGLYYSPSKRSCDFNNECGSEVRVPTSRSAQINCECENCLYPDAGDCTRYYFCLNGSAYEMQCSDGLHFNREISSCDYEGSVTCEKASVECPTRNGYVKDSENCTRYFHCVGGIAYRKTCASGQHFNEVTERCDDPCLAGCDSSDCTKASTLLPSPICNDGDKFYPHPENCNAFYTCFNGQAELAFCTDGDHFSPTARMCQEPCKALCDHSLDCVKTTVIIVSTEVSVTTGSDASSYVESTTNFALTSPISETTEHATTVQISTSGLPLTSEPSTSATSFTSEATSTEATLGTTSDTSSEDPFTPTAELTSFEPTTISAICNISDGVYPKPGDCSSFFVCTSGIPSEQKCDSHLHFSPRTLRCEFPCYAECDPNIDCSTTQLPDLSTHQPFNLCPKRDLLPGKKCDQYINCTSDRPLPRRCPVGLHFNPTTRVCDWPKNAGCGKSGSLPDSDPNYSCPCETCLIASAESCAEYHLCIGYVSYTSKCSAGLLFDSILKTCNRESKVICEKGITTTPSTTTSTPYTTVSTTVKSTTPTETFKCPSADGYFQKSGECGRFIQCANWRPYVMKCPSTLHFSMATLRCEYPCDAKCDLSLACSNTSKPVATDKICASCLNCKIKDPESCVNYFECKNGRARRMFCRRGQTFDSERGVCDWAHKVECHSHTCPKMNGLFPYEGDCHKFLHCANGIPYINKCHNNLEFDPVALRCSWPSGRCGSTTQSPPTLKPETKSLKDFDCPKSFGVFRDEENCNRFYHCSHGIAFAKECPQDLVFNPKHQTCDWKENVKCNSNRQYYYQRRCRVYDRQATCPQSRVNIQHSNCDMFFDCTSGSACGKRCPVGLYFNSTTAVCDRPENVQCYKGKNEVYSLEAFAKTCYTKGTGFMADPAMNYCFYRCHQEKVIRGCCPRNAVFNVEKDKCEIHRRRLFS